MTKQAFIDGLRQGLAGLPGGDIEERINFYSEMIDDRIEDGLGEEEAVAEIGNLSDVISQIYSETPLTHIVKDRIKPKRELKTWEIVLIVLGFPVWLPILITVFALFLAFYIVMIAIAVALYSIAITLVLSGIASIAFAVMYIITYAGANPLNMIAYIGAGLVLAGLGIPMFFVCRLYDKGIAVLTRKIAGGIKSAFAGRRNTK